MRSRSFFGALIGLTAALLLALGLGGPSPARAASTVDVTYDLADTDIVWTGIGLRALLIVSNDDDGFLHIDEQQAGIVAGAMQVSYASDSSSGLAIQTGPATLESFALTAKSLVLTTGRATLSATLRWQLTEPATASLTASGGLTGLDVGLLMTGRADCLYEGGGAYTADYVCRGLFGVPSFTIYPSYFRSGPLELAGTAVPSGGIQSTRHTLTGRGRAIGWQPGGGAVGLGYDRCSEGSPCGVHIVGREILREGEGHDPKVIPEPTTLLLLAAGTAGLALTRRTPRRARSHR